MQMFRTVIGALAATTLALAAAGAPAEPRPAGAITVSEPVLRASIGAAPNSAAYMVIANAGGAPDRLMSASCACAAKVEAHETHPMAGMPSMMMMSATGPVAIPAHGSVRFHPGGLHLMLTGLKTRLADGAEQKITLVFEHAGAITVDFRIRAQVAANGGVRVYWRG
jgi:copper(I)-binding protein